MTLSLLKVNNDPNEHKLLYLIVLHLFVMAFDKKLILNGLFS